MNRTNSDKDKRTQSLRFLEKRLNIPFRKMEEVVDFPLLWALFEHEYGNGRRNFGIDAVEKIADELKECLGKCHSCFDSAWEHFRERYAKEGKIDHYHLSDLFHRAHKKNFVKEKLEAEYCCTLDKVKALLFIIYRLRNNFFHGKKYECNFKDQNENFRYANEILIKIIELKS